MTPPPPRSRLARFDLLFAGSPPAAGAVPQPRALHRVGVLALVAVAAGLRFAGLGEQSFSTGEATWVAQATAEPASLHGALLRAAAALLGPGDAATRAPSALAGVATVLAVHHLVRRLASGRAALVCAALLAVAPLHLSVSQDARPAAVVFLVASLAALAILRAAGQDRVAAATSRLASLWRSRRLVVVAACAALVPVAAFAMATAAARPDKTDWRAAVAAVEARIRPGDLLLFDARPSEIAYLRYALRADDRALAVPAARESIARAVDRRPRVWLVLADVENERAGRRILGREWRETGRVYARGVQAVILERSSGR